MRLTLFALLTGIIQSYAVETYAQMTRLTLDVKNSTVKDVLSQIEAQSEFFFLYNSKLVDVDREVNIEVKEKKISDVLDMLFEGTNTTYKIVDRQIVLTSSEMGRNYETQQQNIVSGKVTDSSGNSLPGVTVIIKGTNTGTITNPDGSYSLSNVPSSGTLVFSFVGMKTQEIPVAGKRTIEVTMTEETVGIEEVVAIGYGTMKKSDLTGAVASVTGPKLSNINATSVAQALQGTMPGVQITRTSGLPGAGATIRIRGITTIGDSDPLVIVDGIPVSSINSLDVDDIESISVMKDAASASIYGARSSAGVILVTTKRAKTNQFSLEYDGTIGFVEPTQFPGQVNYKRYMEMINEIAWNDNDNITGAEYSVYSQDFIESYAQNHQLNPDAYPITDWVDLLIKNRAPRYKHRLSITSGTNVIKSKFLVNYEKTDALYNNRSYGQVTFRINNDITINKYLSAQIDASFLHSLSENPVVNPIDDAFRYGPLWAPYWSDGRISGGRNGTNVWARVNYGGFNNNWADEFSGKFVLNFTPVKNLTFTGVYAPSVQIPKGKQFIKQIGYYGLQDSTWIQGYVDGNLSTSLNEQRNERRTSTKQFLANYKGTIGENHNLAVLAGYEDYYRFSESLDAFSDKFELSEYPYLDRAPLNYMRNSGNANENAYISFFGRANYNFANKYLIQANIRADASSRFHKDYRWGKFPSVSLGWVITKEAFIENLDFKDLSFLKLRASWGTLGNERIGNYPYQSIMNFGNSLFVEGNQVVPRTTAYQESLNIRNITWETTETWDVGFDATFLKDRLSLSGDYYKKNTRNMLLELEIPDFIGYSNPEQNAGTMHTNGWEVQLGWNGYNRKGDFSYSFNANISDYRSQMGDLSGIVILGDKIIREGSDYQEWYGYLSDHLYQSKEDINSSPLLNNAVRPGDVKYKDISGPEGVPDGLISPEYDRVLLGGSLPRFLYGGSISLDYKGFDASATFQGVGKQKSRLEVDMVYQTAAWYTFADFVDGNYYSKYNSDEKNKSVRYPRLSQIAYKVSNYYMSDFWLFDGSYFRLKNITLGYTLPKKMSDVLKISKLRIYASVSDLFSFDKYPKGWDPEASLQSYIARNWNFGASINF